MLRIAFCAAGLLAVCGAASAQTLFQTGWEAPTWNLGNIPGQNGFDLFPGTSATAHQVVGATTVGSQTVTPASGSQMHQSSVLSGISYAWPDLTAGWAARTAGNDVAWSSFSIFLPSSNTSTAWHGIRAFNSAGSLLGGLQFRNSDGAGVITNNAGANFLLGLNIPRDQWVSVAMGLDFVAGRISYNVNGVVFASVLPTTVGAALGDVDLVSVQAGTASAGGVAFTDDFRVAAIPAPGAAVLMAMGGLLCARRRRA
jgi:hypothetical protein